MAILQSCCCWRSLRRGCYASAAFTGLYFTVAVCIMSTFVHEEMHYYRGNASKPVSDSFLETDTISPTTMVFNIIVLVCAVVGIVASIILAIGVYSDNRLMLVPWIFTITISILVDVAHSIYLFVLEMTKFNPMTAILFTFDFFFISLHIYCLLCVISQYQEYKAGRGTIDFEDICRTVVRYVPPPTGTSLLSTRRGPPTTCLEKSAQMSPAKHQRKVQFDGLHATWTNDTDGGESKILPSGSPSDAGSSGEWLVKVAATTKVDTEPLIASVKSQVHKGNKINNNKTEDT